MSASRTERTLRRLEINRLLAAKGWGVGELAKLCGLARGTVLNLISGTNQTPLGRAKIEKALGASIWENTAGKSAKHP